MYKTKRKSPTKEERKLVYQMYDGHCAYCGCKLELKEMQVDHFNSIYAYDGENNIDNYMPSCRQCNFYKGVGTIEQFRQNLKETMWAALKKTFQYRMLLKYNLIQENDIDVRFYFEDHKNQVTHRTPVMVKHNGNPYIVWRVD